MTTVAYRNGELAVDSGVWQGHTLTGLMSTKAQMWTKTGVTTVAAGAGVLAPAQAFIAALKRGKVDRSLLRVVDEADDDKDLSASVLVVTRSKKGLTVTMYHHWGVEDMSDREFTAFGSGYEAAMAVMFLGHTAEEAVVAAAQTDAHTRLPVHVFRV